MTLASPPLAMSEGRNVRQSKTTLPAPLEIKLHMTVAKILRDHLFDYWRFTHIPAGEVRDKRTAAKLKAMGTMPHWPDFQLVDPNGVIHFLELKRIGEKLSEGQKNFQSWCVENHIPHVVAWTLDEVLMAFVRWHCLRIKIPTCVFILDGSEQSEHVHE